MPYSIDWDAVAAVGFACRSVLNTLAVDLVLLAFAYWIWRKAKKV